MAVIGRPTIYTEDMILKVNEYLSVCEEKKDLPNIEGLAYYLRITKPTIYEWCKEHEDFSYVIDDLRHTQANKLINNGLKGSYNSTIAKVLLTKHGYREGLDSTTNDKDLPQPIINVRRD